MSGAIQQQGPVTAGHVAVFYANGEEIDGGTAGDGLVSELGITNAGGLAFAINSGTIAAEYTQLGFTVGTNGGVTISANSFNGGPAASLNVNLNGVNYPFPGAGNGNVIAPGTVVSGNLASFNGTNGSAIQDSGLPTASVMVAVASIALLQAATALSLPSDLCFVTGYASPADGGEGAFAVKPSDTTSADNGGTIIVDVAGRRWHRMTGGAPYCVKWFGATGNGTTDDTAAVNNTFAAIAAAGATYSPALGGQAWFPPGVYNIAGTLTHSSGIWMAGAGKGAVTLQFANGAADDIQIEGAANAFVYGWKISDLTFTHPNTTGGRSIASSYAYRSVIENVQDIAPYTGWEIYNNNDTYIENVVIQGVAGGSGTNFNSFGPSAQKPNASYGIFWHAPADGSAQAIQLTTVNTTVYAGYSGADGYVWDGFATTWFMIGTTALNTRYGLWVKNTLGGGAGNWFPSFLQATNFNTDGMTHSGLRIDGGSQFQIVNSEITNTSGSPGQGSADTYAVQLNADLGQSYTNAIWLIGCRIGSSKETALYIAARNVVVDSCFFEPGETTPSNTYPAVQIAAPAQDITIDGCQYNEWGGSLVWKYGLQVDNGTFRVSVTDNNILSPQTSPILWNNTDANSQCFGNMSSSPAVNLYDPAPYILPQGDVVGGSFSITAIRLLGRIYAISGTPSGAFNGTTATAAQIVAAAQNPALGKCYELVIINGTGQDMTLLGGSGVNVALISPVIATGTAKSCLVYLADVQAGFESIIIRDA